MECFETNNYAKGVLDFIAKNPSAFHAVDSMAQVLREKAGFKELEMSKAWELTPGGLYYVRYNGTALVAFGVGKNLPETGYRMIASHSDAPTFRIKPQGIHTHVGNMARLSTEPYGGALLYTWLDRPLSLAGRVIARNHADALHPTQYLVDFGRPVAIIPSVAIHFNRNVNEGASFNKQIDMQLLTDALTNDNPCGTDITSEVAKLAGVKEWDVLDYDLYAYVCGGGSEVGFDSSLITSPRLDNLAMAYCSCKAMLDWASNRCDDDCNKMLIVMDNEEVGSGTKQGAAAPLVRDIVRRIADNIGLSESDFQRVVYNSFLVSADMAHALHPNHPELSDPLNAPKLNCGPAIKYNAQQKYMTDADGAAVFASICESAGVPFQRFVNRSDIAGGSTLGNIMTGHLPIRGVDVGNPMLGMHSCCETAGAKDIDFMTKAMSAFYKA